MMEVDYGPLASNAELHGYLLQTAEALTRLGQSDAAMKVRDAAAQATGLSTELLGESRNALVEALRSAGSALSSVDRDRLAAVINQLDRALKR
jgi:hypothetical protein